MGGQRAALRQRPHRLSAAGPALPQRAVGPVAGPVGRAVRPGRTGPDDRPLQQRGRAERGLSGHRRQPGAGREGALAGRVRFL